MNDIDALGLMKVDVLALGMLTCIRKTRKPKRERLVVGCIQDVGRGSTAGPGRSGWSRWLRRHWWFAARLGGAMKPEPGTAP